MDELLEYKKNSILGKIGGQKLCDEYRKAWQTCGNNKEKLVRFSMQQQSIPHLVTACYQGLGLTKNYIKENFKDYINGYIVKNVEGVEGYTYGLYIDWNYKKDLDIKTDVSNIMWCIGVRTIIPQTKCPILYISNSSTIHLVGEGYNNPTIYLFDDSKVIIDDIDEVSKVRVYKYGEKAKVEVGKYCLGDVRVFEKELRL